ncbi:MAG: hypothetical protein ACRDTG_29640 [Pseudonocardiaceae bacterium]
MTRTTPHVSGDGNIGPDQLLPLTYTWWKRLCDVCRGRRDGRKGLPQIPANYAEQPPTIEQLTTPYMLTLQQRYIDQAEVEGYRTETMLAPLREQVAEAVSRIQRFEAEVAAAEQAVKACPEKLPVEALATPTLGDTLSGVTEEQIIARARAAHAHRLGQHRAYTRLRISTYSVAVLDKHPRQDLLQQLSSRLDEISLDVPEIPIRPALDEAPDPPQVKPGTHRELLNGSRQARPRTPQRRRSRRERGN